MVEMSDLLTAHLITQSLVLFSEFIQSHYVKLKQDNPKLPILIRECSGTQPRLWTRFGKAGQGVDRDKSLKLHFYFQPWARSRPCH